MALLNNTVFQREDTRYRVLSVYANKHVFVIRIDDAMALPEIIHYEALVDEIASGAVKLIDDPKLPRLLSDEALSDAERKVRDRAWNCIQPLVEKIPDIFRPKARSVLVAARMVEMHVSRQAIYGWLRRYWMRGMIPAALVADYAHCGAKGVARLGGDKKRGRPRSLSTGRGVNIDYDTLRIMRTAWAKYMANQTRGSLRRAYNWMLMHGFPDDVVVITRVSQQVTVKIINPERLPSFDQFEYHFKKENNLAARKLSKHGARKFEQLFRQLLKNSLSEVRGPGSRYQIDATIADTYIVSRLARNRIVGRPTVYLVIDVFSRMIVGIYVGLEPPSWIAAIMALLNAAEDKVKYCARYGIDITPEQWPASELPLAILGDRGEMESKMADTLATAFNIQVENAPPYRGDAKGIVERHFRSVQADFGEFVPGYVEKGVKKRGGPDYRLDAALTIEEFTKIIIYSVLDANLRVRRDYPGEAGIAESNIPHSPLALWQWGKDHFRSDARRFDMQYVKVNLLPQKKVKVTRKGLKFQRGLYYFNTEIVKEHWYFRAQETGEELKAAYHPMDMTMIYVISPVDRARFYRCDLVNHCHQFSGMALSEVVELGRQQRVVSAWDQQDTQPQSLSHQRNIENIIDVARIRAKKERDPSLSAAERTRGIRANRLEERQDGRGEHVTAFGLGQSVEASNVTARAMPIDPDEVAEMDELAEIKNRRLPKPE
ncbi:MAG: Mu transposase C-terminal domain-containing protein [Pseudomonadota bacterium]